MPISSPHCVVVIGAGPVGLLCALYLACADVPVCVIDSGARGAGWASGGMLGGVYEALDDGSPPSLQALAQISLPLWHALSQDLSIPLFGPTLFVARNGVEGEHLRAHLDATIPAVPLPQGLVGQAAWRCEADVALDPRATLSVLRRACAAAGVGFEQGDVVRVDAATVHLRDGRTLGARKIVIATGQGGAGLQDSVPELGCIIPVKGQLLRLAGAAAVLDAKIVRAGRIYLIARGGDVIVGATSGGGQDARHIHVDDQRALYQEACQLVPALQSFWPSESWAGLRPMTPDALPLLGETAGTGAILACGTYRNGWLLAPVLAQAIVELVQGCAPLSSPTLATQSQVTKAGPKSPSPSWGRVGMGGVSASALPETQSLLRDPPSPDLFPTGVQRGGKRSQIAQTELPLTQADLRALSPSRFPIAPRRAMSGQ